MQFSQYNFDAKSLIVNQTDGEGEESITEINIEEDGADFGPVFDDYTDSVELLFDLLGPELDRLPALENDREFVLSLGGEEAIATIGADGKVTFENPEHLARLNSEDLLSLRLYLNGDAGNVLWEYQMAGFSSFWSIYPNQQPERIRNSISVEEAVAQQLNLPLDWLFPKAYAGSTDLNVEDQGSYYTLGGMRVKLLFQAEKNNYLGAPVSVIWNSSAITDVPELAGENGDFYSEESPSATSLGSNHPEGAALSPSPYLYQIYYQPPGWTTGQNITITAKVRYQNQPNYKSYEFSLKTRELYPVTADNPNIYDTENPQAPIQGADVAMLESVLWQLGISPQKGSPGSEGSRINSDRGNDRDGNPRGWTHYCDGTEARERDVFSTGWSSCAAAQVSLEAMVKRYRTRRQHTAIIEVGNTTTINGYNAVVDEPLLTWLKEDWKNYRKAAYAHTLSVLDNEHPQIDTWAQTAADIWQNGAGTYAPQTLDDTEWERVLVQSGTNGRTGENQLTKTRLLTSWIEEESRLHWGGGYPVTNYRMYEGGADENGSLSFSQVVYKDRYGALPCAVHNDQNLNLYDPGDQLKTLVLHTVSNSNTSPGSSNCLGGMHRGFVGNTPMREDYQNVVGSVGDTTNPLSDFIGYINNSDNTLTIREQTLREDDYEALAKVIAIYNGARRWMLNYTWPRVIKDLQYDSGSKANGAYSKSGICHSCKYSIQVRNHSDLFEGSLRKYVWRGGIYPATNDAGVPYPLAGQEWCFVYGELKWINGEEFEVVKEAADIFDSRGNEKDQIGAINCITGNQI